MQEPQTFEMRGDISKVAPNKLIAKSLATSLDKYETRPRQIFRQ